MKNDLLNELLMILINDPACNTTAANTSVMQACVEFQDKKRQKNRGAFIKSKLMGTQASMNKEIHMWTSHKFSYIGL